MKREPTKLEIERGERVRFLREKVLRIRHRKDLVKSSKDLVKSPEYLIKLGSLENWESGRHGGLVEKSAPKLIKAAFALNVKCSIEWLLWGIGELPKPFNSKDAKDEAISNDFRDDLISLRKDYPNLIDTIVQDDALAPCFLPGDYVAGEQFFGDKLLEAIDKPCIIQTNSGKSLIRLLQNSSHRKGYILACTNPCTEIQPAHLKETEMLYAAPIVWMRRKK